MRRAGRELLSLALIDARNHTLHLLGLYEQAMEKALDAAREAREAREAERQPLREQQQREQRMVLHENQRTASDPFETYLNENAERIRREWERRWHERKAREPDDSSRDR